jgi:hypothetical protein
VVAKVRERLTGITQAMQEIDTDKFNLIKLHEAEGTYQYQVKILTGLQL